MVGDNDLKHQRRPPWARRVKQCRALVAIECELRPQERHVVQCGLHRDHDVDLDAPADVQKRQRAERAHRTEVVCQAIRHHGHQAIEEKEVL